MRDLSLHAAVPQGELLLKLPDGDPDRALLWLNGLLLADGTAGASERRLAMRGVEIMRTARAGDGEACMGGDQSRGWRVLVAGLGLGITLAGLLGESRVTSVDVIELFAPVVEWNREVLGPARRAALEDARVNICVAEVVSLLQDLSRRAGRRHPVGRPLGRPASRQTADMRRGRSYDLMLFDIDNGPAQPSLPGNSALYETASLNAISRLLYPGGAALFWSAEPSPALLAKFRSAAHGLPLRVTAETVPWRDERCDRPFADTLYVVEKRA